jgi:hypothetical protein
MSESSRSEQPVQPTPAGAAAGAQWEKQGAHPDQIRFLRGPQPRGFELGKAWELFCELVRGLRAFHFLAPCVTVLGSARLDESSPQYALAREVGQRLARSGFTVMTGGGPGMMEAANRGAKDVGGASVGCNIRLAREQNPNPYVDRWITFNSFAVRKLMLVKYSYAFIAMPGGYGTLDEIFEVATLIETHKIKNFPFVLLGREYWGPLVGFLHDRLLEGKMIDREDFERFFITDSPEEAVDAVSRIAMSQFGLTYGPKAKRRWYLWE